MQDRQQTRRIPVSLAAGIAALVLAVGGGTAWWASKNAQTPPQTTSPKPAETAIPVTPAPSASAPPIQIPIQTPQVIVTPAPKTAGAIFWLKDTPTNTELVPVPIKLNNSTQPSAVLEAAFNQLLAGPTEATTFSAIPQGTKLGGVTVKDDGVHLDLSREFNSGGGSASMIARLAQVLYTATSLDDNAKVWISVDGKPLELLGGEGLEVPQPMTRQNFQKEFPL